MIQFLIFILGIVKVGCKMVALTKKTVNPLIFKGFTVFLLFPLHSSRWFARNIVHDPVDVCDFVDDADADFL